MTAEEIQIKAKEQELKEKEFELKEREFEYDKSVDEQKVKFDKIEILESLLRSVKPDVENSFGSERQYIQILSQSSADLVERQLIKLVKEIC